MIPFLVMVTIMTSNVQAASVPALPPCPEKPNCVSSQSSGNRYIEPFRVTEAAGVAFGELRKLLAGRSDTTIILTDDTSIRVEFRTTLCFVDDALFLLDPATGLIHVRSAARLGYWDLGKNRRRMEEIRQEFAKVR